MHPSVISEITHLGSSLLSRGIESLSRTNQPPANPKLFSKQLAVAQSLDPKENIEEIQRDILDSPAISNFLKQNRDCVITLDQLADGSMKISSSSGDFITLDHSSELCTLARKYYHACQSEGVRLSKDRPGSVTLIA